MAQTTTSENACDVKIQIDNSSGAPTDVSGSSNQASMSMAVDSAETSTFDGQWKIRKSCKTSVSVSLQVLYSLTADEGLDIMRDWFFSSPGTPRTVTVNVPDDTAGSDRYSGEFVLTSFDIPLSADDAGIILCSASLENSGAFAHNTVAS
jgi:hypothetical protein